MGLKKRWTGLSRNCRTMPDRLAGDREFSRLVRRACVAASINRSKAVMADDVSGSSAFGPSRPNGGVRSYVSLWQ